MERMVWGVILLGFLGDDEDIIGALFGGIWSVEESSCSMKMLLRFLGVGWPGGIEVLVLFGLEFEVGFEKRER